MSTVDPAEIVDETLGLWRQGDCVVGPQWVIHKFDVSLPLMGSAVDAAGEDSDVIEAEAPGLVVTTQTCDIVKPCRKQPYVQVSPLVEVDFDLMRQVQLALRPSLAFIPGVADLQLVADLSRVMTVEKPVLVKWTRLQGCSDEIQARRLAQALGRSRMRAAFPDEFNKAATRLRNRLRDKHGNDTSEGRALESLREIRVHASPSWRADEIKLTLLFIRRDDVHVSDEEMRDHIRHWLQLWIPRDPFGVPDWQYTSLDDMLAREFVDSDPLDLDYLSMDGEDDDPLSGQGSEW